MNKRAKMSPAYRLPAACITVTKVDVAFTSTGVEPERAIEVFELSAAAIKKLAIRLKNRIENGGYKTSPCAGIYSATTLCGTTDFRQTRTANAADPIWFIGDLHGDLAALKALTEFARRQNERDGLSAPTRLFFLGDLVDGAPFSAEVIAWIMKAWNNKPRLEQEKAEMTQPPPFEVMAVIGNHDNGLRFVENDTGGEFVSSVSPSTFAQDLNRRMKEGHREAWKQFGCAAIEFFEALPRMVMLNQTVMVAHGGVPHSDVVIATRADLNTPQALGDFIWNRLHETAPKKIPNRESHGSQVGIKNFDAFVAKLADTAGVAFSPKIFIRGHDHHEGNFKRYENYKLCSVLTLNAFTVNRDFYGQKYRDLALLRWIPSETDKMTLFRLRFQSGGLEQIWRVLLPERAKGNIQDITP